MAFKLKSPFHVTQVEQSLKKGGVVGQGSNSSVVLGLTNTDIASVEGTQTVSPEPNNESVDNLVKKTEEGVPLGLNPKQEARFKTRKYKKGLRDDARFDRQTEKAERIYERNQFENLDGEYRNPEEAAGIKSDRAEKELEQNQMQKILESNLPLAEREKKINEVRSKSKFYNDKILSDKEEKSQPKDNLVMRNKEEEFKNPLLQMKGKPNRAGTPVRMLKSMEDKTPMKYKSVRKAGRENLMSALAKQGEPIDVKKVIKKVAYNMIGGPGIDAISRIVKDKKEPVKKPVDTSFKTTPETNFKSTKPGASNQPSRVTVGDRAKESVKKAVKLGLAGGGLKL